MDQCDIIPVEAMDGPHAQALFEMKVGKQDKQRHNSQDIAELAAALDCIPLAIVQAAACIANLNWSCSVR